MKLELKHIAPYLPYEVKYLNTHEDFIEKEGVIHIDSIGSVLKYEFLKPILRPLSDLTKEIEETEKTLLDKIVFESNGHCDAYEEWLEHYIDMNDESCIEQAPFEIVQELFKLHFDIFGLIEQGLAIDINTLEK